ncbi:DUF1501 domain-containing protein [Pseudorhodoferax sp. Leaf267]|uniref:DUF1501 domain-containing protein n=1 Tax=Pseudorhodoferax sp. Leaf267 TaxID=1736316 RepID=UPI0006FC3E0F|nr:DUF1501 domain-containing protein [Pseudorhodoferax sp. Leaf267]KQP19235.1 hypothetical protein ASF43_29030 [Pseudorhodoferax sp. Leaf267]
MHRRTLLHALAATPLAMASAHLAAASHGTPRVLLVFLRGAYDAANLLVPATSTLYHEKRPTIAIEPPGSGPDAAVALDADWGLHPAVARSMRPLFERRQLAFVPFAGTDDASRSHFTTQNSIELGQPLQGTRDLGSGFLNRLAQVLGMRDAIAFSERLPLCLRGNVAVPNLGLARLAPPALDARQSQLVRDMYAGTPLATPVQEGFAVREAAERDIEGLGAIGEMVEANQNAITAKGFEGEARRIARLMRERYHLGFVDVGGWDTHANQGGRHGYLASRLDQLGQGLAGFADEMGPAWADTTVVVLSEFGRTFAENGNRGTDHGHGSVYWVLGGGVRGGRIAGEQVALTAANLHQNRDYPVLNEYRALLGGLFARLYGLDAGQLGRVFPGATTADLGLA